MAGGGLTGDPPAVWREPGGESGRRRGIHGGPRQMGGPAEGSVREKLGFGKFGGRWPMWVAGEEEEMRLAVQLGQRAATQGLTNGPSFLWLPNVIGTYLYLYHPRIIKKEKLLKKGKVYF
jgi:hypothetical protein